MEKRNFFGTEGLTSTSASHVAELCNNYCDEANHILNSCKFYGETVSLLSGGTSKVLSVGWDSNNVKRIPELLETVIDAYSLCAWLKEAIKEKERLYKEALNFTYNATREELELHRPVKVRTITPEDVISKWSVGEQEKYLSLQTRCAVIGKFIHKDRPFYLAKQSMLEKMTEPTSIKGSGADTIIVEYGLSVTTDEVASIEAKLQADHRAAQAELNGMKNRIEEEIKADEIAKTNAYNLAMQSHEQQKEALARDEAEERQRLSEKVSALRILIPNNLMGIYEKVTRK